MDRPKLGRPAHRRYFFVCTQGNWHWWDLFLRRGYAHCFLLIWDECVWIAVHPTQSITEVSLVMPYKGEFANPKEWLLDPKATVVEAELEWSDSMRVPWVISPVTCVEVIKSVLGIRRFWLWTPYQLQRYLTRRWGDGCSAEAKNS